MLSYEGRTSGPGQFKTPALVTHGDDDPLFPMALGDTDAVYEFEFKVIKNMIM